MKRFFRVALLALVAAHFLPEASLAQGTITVSVDPAVQSLPAARTTPTFTLRWQIAKTPPLGPPIFSPAGSFATPGGLPLGTNPTTLIDPGPPPAGVPTTSTAIERLRIPASVVRSAQAAGATTIVYSRTFQDTGLGVPGTAAARFQLVGGLGGPFEVTFFRLHFEDESALKVIKPDATLHAIADVSYSGQGVIDAVWEVADSGLSRTGGAVTNFQLLRRVRRNLDGSGRVHLRSPVLPTGEAGLHQVRLRFVAPGTAFELPTIRYFVLGGKVPGLDLAPLPLVLGTPPAQAALTETTSFSWEPVPDTRVYQLEFFAIQPVPANEYPPDAALEPSADRQVILIEDPLPNPMVTGVLVPPDKTQLTLPPYARHQLGAGKNYSWRVRALAADGSILAESTARELRVPVSWRGSQTSAP